jgi:HEAT repeat protein
LGQIGGEQALDLLIARLGTEDRMVCTAVEEALGALKGEAVPQVTRALQSSNLPVRRSAARVLGKISDAASVEPLIQALQDREASVRLEAARGLGRVGDKRAMAPLEQAQQDPDEAVRRMARTSSRMMNTRFDSR